MRKVIQSYAIILDEPETEAFLDYYPSHDQALQELVMTKKNGCIVNASGDIVTIHSNHKRKRDA